MQKSAPPPPPRPAELTAGVSLIVAVLGISFFLLIVIGVSLSLSVNSRQTVINSGQVLAAQYAAENAATQAQTRLRVAERMMNTLNVPRGVTARTFYDDIREMCGGAAVGTFQGYVPNTADPNSQVWLDRDPAPDRENWQRMGQVMCTFTEGQGIPAAGLLGKPLYYKNSETGAEGVAALNPLLGMTPTETQLATFWQQIFAGQGRSSVNQNVAGAQSIATYGMQPVQLVRLGFSWYRLVFAPGEIVSQGTAAGSQRRLGVSDNNTRYYLDLRQDSFARYALFTDHHYTNPASESGGGGNIWFTENTRFNGPVHTNQVFNFTTQVSNGLGATFGGRVTSAGCARNRLTATGCDQFNQGARFNSRDIRFRTAAQLDPTPRGTVSPSNYDPVRLTENGISTDFEQGIDFRSEWIQLPQNVNDQLSLARSIDDPIEGTGLSFAGNVDRMELRAVQAGSPVRAMQQIIATVGTVTTNMLIDDQKRVYLCISTASTPLRSSESFDIGTCRYVRATKATAGAAWTEAPVGVTPIRFNGVVHVAGDVRWLGGPNRTAQPAANNPAQVGTHVPPAVAAHAQLNITANRDINVYRDLKYQQDPRTNPGATNVLGLFSAGVPNSGTGRVEGFVNLMGDTGEPDSVRRRCDDNGLNCDTVQDRASQASGYVQNDRAPDDLSIDATMLASFGSVRVNGYNRGEARGQMHLLGGIIEQYYGPFGQFGGTRQVQTGTRNGECVKYEGRGANRRCVEWEQIPVYTTVQVNPGYGRNYDYDTRFDEGLAPPGFPTQPVWTREVNIQPGATGRPQNVPASFANVGFWRQVGR